MTPTTGLRERKNARTREAITRAALELSLEVGFDRATIAQIAERADVSPRTVYAWYPSKEDIVVGPPDGPRERLAAELARTDGDIVERVRRWMQAEGDRHSEPEDLMRLRQRVLVADAHLRALQRGRLTAIEDLIAGTVAKELGLPESALAPRALAAAMAAMLLGLQERFAAGADAETGDLERTLAMLRAALGALRDHA